MGWACIGLGLRMFLCQDLRFLGLPFSRIAYLLKDLYKKVTVRNQQKVGSLGFGQGLGLTDQHPPKSFVSHDAAWLLMSVALGRTLADPQGSMYSYSICLGLEGVR